MTNPLIERMLAMSKTHECVTLYADGSAHVHPSHSLAGANNYAVGERRKIGRDLIDRATGKTVTVVAVYVRAK